MQVNRRNQRPREGAPEVSREGARGADPQRKEAGRAEEDGREEQEVGETAAQRKEIRAEATIGAKETQSVQSHSCLTF